MLSERVKLANPSARKVIHGDVQSNALLLVSKPAASIARFNAYLAAEPAVRNAGEVRRAIGDLDVRFEGTLERLINQSKEAAEKAVRGLGPNDPHPFQLWQYVVEAQATVDVAAAKRLAIDKMRHERISNWCGAFGFAQIAMIQGIHGDIDGGKSTARSIGSYTSRMGAYRRIALETG